MRVQKKPLLVLIWNSTYERNPHSPVQFL